MIREIGTTKSLIVFPEGSRSVSGEMGEFKSGLYYLAKKRPDIELVPVHIDNLFGNAQFPNILPAPRLIFRGSVINVTAQDMGFLPAGTTTNTLTLTFSGEKLY